MTRTVKRWLGVVLILLVAVVAQAPAPAHALSLTIDSVGDSQLVKWKLDVGGNILSAEALFTAIAVSSTVVDVSIAISNTTLVSLGDRVASLGFQTDPAVTAALLSPGAVFDAVKNDVVFPGLQTIEVCAFAGNNCAGGGYPSLLAAGASDSFALRLTGNFNVPPVLTLDTFAVKFQGDLGSFTVVAVPAPTMLMVLGAGLLGTWLLARRRS